MGGAHLQFGAGVCGAAGDSVRLMRMRALRFVLGSAPALAATIVGCVSSSDGDITLPEVEAGVPAVDAALDRGPVSDAGALLDGAPDAVDGAVPDAAHDSGDASSDAPLVDTGIDASLDATADASRDTGVDAPLDGAVEAAVDGAVDAAVDASPDAGPHAFVYTVGFGSVVGFDWQPVAKTFTPIDMDPASAGNQNAAASGTNNLAIVAHPSGKFVFTANGAGNTVGAYVVNSSTGALTRIDVDAVTAGVQDEPSGGVGAGFVAVHPTLNKLYVTNYASNNLITFTVDAVTGALSSPVVTGVGSSPRGIAVSPLGDALAVVNAGDATITTFHLDGAGLPITVSDAGAATIGTGANPISVVFDSTGNHLYTANSGISMVTSYSVDANTLGLTSLGTAPTANSPLGMAARPSGNYLYVAAYGNEVDPFDISNGNAVKVSSVFSISQARAADFDSTGTLFIGNDLGSLYALSVDGSTGALTLLGSAIGMPVGSYRIAVVNR